MFWTGMWRWISSVSIESSQRLRAEAADQRAGRGGFVGASGLPVCFSCVVQPDRTAVRRAVAPFAQANDIPWVKFGKDDVGAKLELMRPHLDRQAATG